MPMSCLADIKDLTMPHPVSAGTPSILCDIGVRLYQAGLTIISARDALDSLPATDEDNPVYRFAESQAAMLNGALLLLLSVDPALDHVQDMLKRAERVLRPTGAAVPEAGRPQ